MNASDARRLGIQNGDTIEVWNDRGKCVTPVYVTERLMPGVVVLHEGAWMDLDEKRRRPLRQPGFPDPRRADPGRGVRLQHHPGRREEIGAASTGPAGIGSSTARSHVFRRDL